MYIHTDAKTDPDTHIHTATHTHKPTRTQVQIQTETETHTQTQADLHAYIHIHMGTPIHTYTLAHTYRHTGEPRRHPHVYKENVDLVHLVWYLVQPSSTDTHPQLLSVESVMQS